MDPVRNSAKGIIIRESSLLVIVHRDEEGEWYSLPGGGQEPGETLTDALQRECLEEMGVRVQVGPLCHVREYIGAHHEFSREDADSHQVDFMFECALVGEFPASPPSNPDKTQIGIGWLPLSSLPAARLYPKELRPWLAGGIDRAAPVYLGDVN